jgi:signal transduction histidine kinase
MERGASEQLAAHALRLLALAGNLDLDKVLHRVLRSARKMAGARYAAVGVPDGSDGFQLFLTEGISERQAERIGTLPRRHGVLGVLLHDSRAIRLDDIARHPRFSGYPDHHPRMRDFLGVPIRHRGEVLGDLYLSGSRAGSFSREDERLLEDLAAYAGVAIANARLYARSQELTLLQERARVAQELHDSVSQTLFSMVFQARAASLRARDESDRAAMVQLEHQAAGALQEMRSLVHELRPKTLERDGLAEALRDHVAGVRRLHDVVIDLCVERGTGLTLDQEHALFRIAQEALHNALRHAPGAPVRILLRWTDRAVRLEVADQGPGFDPSQLPRTEHRMGLAGMRERAAAAGGRFQLRTRPGDGCLIGVTVAITKRLDGVALSSPVAGPREE